MKRSFTFILALILCVCALGGCGNNDKNKVYTDEFLPAHDRNIQSGEGNYLVRNNASAYQILVEPSYGTYISKAIKELNFYLSECCDVQLQVVLDDGTAKASDRYIALGNTSMSSSLGLDFSVATLKEDGYRMVSADKSIVLRGGADKGTLFAVEDFAEENLGAKAFSSDEIRLPRQNNVELKRYNVLEVPDFKIRSAGYYKITMDETLRDRLKLDFYNQGWIYWSHSHFLIMPPDEYKEKHPDWYDNGSSPTQLCLTNEEMTAQFIENVKRLILENPNCNYIMLGQQDNATFCNCKSCLPMVTKYKESGVQVRFVNKVATAVDEWLQTVEPNRKMTYAMYAYQKTVPAPVNYDSKTGAYSVIDESVKPRSNVGVMYAPLYGCYTHNIYDTDCNSLASASLRGWQATMKQNLFVRIYSAQYAYYYIPYNNWSATQDSYNLLKEAGIDYIFDTSTNETMVANLGELRGYVSSKLMWNTRLNQEDLIAEFAKGYYYEAGEDIINYIKLNRAHWQPFADSGTHLYPSASSGDKYFTTEMWPFSLTMQMENIFESAYKKIEKYKTENARLYTTLQSRIDKERLVPLFIQLELHSARLSQSEIQQKIDFFEKTCFNAGIDRYAEITSRTPDYSIATLVAKWRTNLIK